MTLPAARPAAGRGGAVILMYHRVAALPLDPWNLAVPPESFRLHLEVITREYRPISLADLVESVSNGEIPERAVALTFDDGYADNLHQALPLLERFAAPATVFVTLAALGGRELWWDELERIVLGAGPLPSRLHLAAGGVDFEWTADRDARLAPPGAAARGEWRPWHSEHPTPSHALYSALWQLLVGLDAGVRDTLLDQLAAWAGADRRPRESHRGLEHDELRELAASGLIEIGAHSVSHSSLAGMPIERQRHEIETSGAELVRLAATAVSGFSYPFGKAEHFTAETMAAVRSAGYSYAASSLPGAVSPDDDPFALPRVTVPGDRSAEMLSRDLARWTATGAG